MIFRTILVFLFFSTITSKENTIRDVQRLSYGISLQPTLSMHRANMLPPKPMSICCPQFKWGERLTYETSIYAKYVIDYDHAFSAAFGYRDIGANFLVDSYGIINTKREEGLVRSELQASLSLIHFQMLYHFTPIHRFDLTLGMMIGINASKNYTYKETLLTDDIFFDNGTRFRNSSIGALTGINPRYFGIMIGVSYNIPISSDKLFIKPQVRFTHALRPVQYGIDWFADALNFGIGFEFFPFGEIQRPIRQLVEQQRFMDDLPKLKDSLQHIIHITNSSPGFLTIHRNIHELPFLEEIHEEAFMTEKSPHGSENCFEDYGSCLYPKMLDTIFQRMKQNPNSELHIEIPSGIDAQSLIKRFKEYANWKKIDTMKILGIVNQQKLIGIPRILNDTLISAYELIIEDTMIQHPSIQFTLQSHDILNYDWGLFDITSETVIKKGNGIANTPILIDSIPINFTKGILRCLIVQEGKRELIQSSIQFDPPTVIPESPMKYEIGALFAINSDTLRKIDEFTLLKFEKEMGENDTIIIEAFTDLTGDITRNVELAQNRAHAVSRIFVHQPKEIILSPQKARNSGIKEYQKAYNRIVTIKRKKP